MVFIQIMAQFKFIIMITLDANSLPLIIEKGDLYIKKLEKLKEDLSSEYNDLLNEDDVRITGISDIQTALFHYILSLINIYENLIHYKWWDNHGQYNLTNEQKMQNAVRYYEISNFSCVHAAYAAYEGTLRQFHFSLDSSCHLESSGLISEIIKCLIRKLKNSQYDGNDFILFHEFFNDLRNTIHNHGVYRNPKKHIRKHLFLNIEYEFKHMVAPKFIFPDLVFDLLESSSTHLKQIGIHSRMKNISYIPNIYRTSMSNS